MERTSRLRIAGLVLLVGLAAVLVGAAVGGYSLNPTSEAEAARPLTPVPSTGSPARTPGLFVGDSLTVGNSDLSEGIVRDTSWFYGLVLDPESPVYFGSAVAEPGKTTEWMLENIGSGLASDPGMVLIMGGANDVGQRIAAETSIENLTRMIEQSRDSGAEVVIATIPPRDDPEFRPATGVLNSKIRDLAEREEVTLIDAHSALADPA